ncbi:MAG: hypothetical protein JXA21_23390 [Anaerolineae bacterium]|nr:hypothetical protein [Anaerolineae bacterium]
MNPMVVEPFVEQGAHGGELRYGFVGSRPVWEGLLYWFSHPEGEYAVEPPD